MSSQRVYVIKYALTTGIVMRKVDHESSDGRYVHVEWPGGINDKAMFRKDEVYSTLEEAVVAVKELAQKKIGLLKKQIKKLEAITLDDTLKNFETPNKV